MLSSQMNVADQQPADTKQEHVCVCPCGAVGLPGEQVHVVGHAGQALALSDDVVLLLLPFLHLCVHV